MTSIPRLSVESLREHTSSGKLWRAEADGARYAVGIGAQKCATSWLFAALAGHRDVAVPPEKELDFFSYAHDRGHAWYRRQWSAGGLRTEVSPSYLHDPRAPARLAQFAPGARILVMLRHPVDRAYSHHLHEIARGHIPAQPFAAALADNPDYLEQGYYGRHLENWRTAFPIERFCILFAEDVARDPAAAWARVGDFLDLSGPAPAAVAARQNISDRARSVRLRQALRGGGAALRRLGLERELMAMKRLPGLRHLRQWNDRALRAEVPPLTPAERAELIRVFDLDVAQLSVLFPGLTPPWPDLLSAPLRRPA
ncbi:MAG: sulfotransferase [Pseudomonadota bacterium]